MFLLYDWILQKVIRFGFLVWIMWEISTIHDLWDFYFDLWPLTFLPSFDFKSPGMSDTKLPIYSQQSSNSRQPFKGTVRIISSNPPCKDDNASFTTVPLKTLFGQVWKEWKCLKFWNCLNLIVVSLRKWLSHFYCRKNSKQF